MIEALRQHLKQIVQGYASGDVRVAVLTGAGKYFCSGMDLSSSNQVGSHSQQTHAR
jgi:enoyl-CoA hydratase/carnithine racemase